MLVGQLAGVHPAGGDGGVAGVAGAAARSFDVGARVGGVEVELGELLVEVREGLHGREPAPHVAADGIALEVPGHVLAQVLHAPVLALVELGEQLGVSAQDPRDVAEAGPDPFGAAGEPGGEVGEQPGPSLAAAADDDAVGARLVHHPQRVLRGPHVAVAEHGDVGDGLLEVRDGAPVRGAGVLLLHGAAVEGDRGGADLLGDQARVAVGEVAVVHALAGLERHRHVPGGLDRGAQDAGEQLVLPGQHAAAAATRHLGDGAAEVQVDVVGAVALEDHLHRAGDDRGVHAVQLDGAGPLPIGHAQQAPGLAVVLDQRARGDHLGGEQTAVVLAVQGAELAAQHAEGHVGDPGHGREHHRGVHGEPPDRERSPNALPSWGRRGVGGGGSGGHGGHGVGQKGHRPWIVPSWADVREDP